MRIFWGCILAAALIVTFAALKHQTDVIGEFAGITSEIGGLKTEHDVATVDAALLYLAGPRAQLLRSSRAVVRMGWVVVILAVTGFGTTFCNRDTKPSEQDMKTDGTDRDT